MAQDRGDMKPFDANFEISFNFALFFKYKRFEAREASIMF